MGRAASRGQRGTHIPSPRWTRGEGCGGPRRVGGQHPPSPGESQCLRSGRGEDQRTSPRAGRESCAPVEESLCQSLLVHRRESLFLYNGWGWGALYPSKPLLGPCRRCYFWYDSCHPCRRVVSLINRCLEAQDTVSVCVCPVLFGPFSPGKRHLFRHLLSPKELDKKSRNIGFYPQPLASVALGWGPEISI